MVITFVTCRESNGLEKSQQNVLCYVVDCVPLAKAVFLMISMMKAKTSCRGRSGDFLSTFGGAREGGNKIFCVGGFLSETLFLLGTVLFCHPSVRCLFLNMISTCIIIVVDGSMSVHS